MLVLLLAMSPSLAERFRPYEILGVKRSARPEEIKKRLLAMLVEGHAKRQKQGS